MSIRKGTAEGYDRFYRDAFDIVTSDAVPAMRSTSIAKIRAPRSLWPRIRWGQSALLARRLVEAGVTYVTVNMGGWDTHNNNFKELKTNIAAALRPGAGRPGRRPVRARPRSQGAGDDPTASSAGRRASTPTPAAITGRARCRSSSPAAACSMGQVIGTTDARAEYPTSRRRRSAGRAGHDVSGARHRLPPRILRRRATADPDPQRGQADRGVSMIDGKRT